MEERQVTKGSQAASSSLTLVLTTAFLYLILSTILNFASKGFLEADGVTHYLYARFAFDNPAYLVDVWARPVRMLIHFLPAHFFGLHGVRAASLVCVLLTAWIVTRIAKGLGWKAPAYAGFFLLAQPLLFLHSFSELTEIPFALLGALAILTLLKRQWWLFALISGAMPASRPEGAAFLLMAVVMLGLHKRWYWIPLVFVPLIVWNHVGWVMWGTDAGPWPRWLINQFPYVVESPYPAGPIYRFVAVLPFVVSPFAVPAILIGTWGIVARSLGWVPQVGVLADLCSSDPSMGTGLGVSRPVAPDSASPRVSNLIAFLRDLNAQVRLILVAIPWGFLAVHSYLHWSGKMSSSGEPRYLLAASPFWALLAAYGWTMMVARFRMPRPALIAAIGACVPIIVNFTYPVVPLKPQPDDDLCRQIAAWYARSEYAKVYPVVYATHPLIYFHVNQPIRAVTPKLLASPPKGAMLVYDSLYSSYNSDPSRNVTPKMFDAAGWRKVETGFGLTNQVWQVYLSPEPTSR